MSSITEEQRELVALTQSNFPLVSDPYSELGKQMGESGEDTYQLMKSLRSDGFVRRLGPAFDSYKLGYVSTLCAIAVPDEEVDLSFETSGKITDIFFKEGSNVKKGQLLAKVNDNPLQAELKKLEAQLPLAEARVNRQNLLLKKDAVSLEAYESVETELEKLKSEGLIRREGADKGGKWVVVN